MTFSGAEHNDILTFLYENSSPRHEPRGVR